MDCNEASGFGTAVDRIIYECNLADAHALDSKIDPPATYHRGLAKIDFVLISASLITSVRAASIMALHDGYLSDHRALLVNFDANSLFSGNRSQVTPAVKRRLTSTNSRAVHTYVECMKAQVAKHNLLDEVKRLQHLSDKNLWSDACVLEWEVIDRRLLEARIFAEQKCKVKQSGMLPWSPALQTVGSTLLYWRLRMHRYTNRRVNLRMIKQPEKRLKLPPVNCEAQPLQMILQKIRGSRRAHVAAKSNAKELREEHLRERAAFMAATHGMSAKAIAARERSSQQFRHLRSIFTKGASYGLDRIDVPEKFVVLRPGEQVPRIPLVTKEEIEDVLVPHTEQRFQQHRETPFGSGERQRSLGIDCSSDNARALMQGTYD
jgi:hypothetical protein